MSRNAHNHRLGVGDSPPNAVLGDEPPTAPYPIERGGRATPDRSRPPDIGAACHDTRRVSPAVVVNPDTNAGPEVGTRGNDESAGTGTRQEYGDMVRESRGVRTRPPRPGAWA